jgi:hypothetical protein
MVQMVQLALTVQLEPMELLEQTVKTAVLVQMAWMGLTAQQA